MGRKNKRGRTYGSFKGEYYTTLADRVQDDGELKPLSYVPRGNISKPYKRREFKRKRQKEI